MKRRLPLLSIPIGLALGLVTAATVIETSPAALGWVLGAGLGLMGGAFVAAIVSGDQLVSGPAPKRGTVGSAPWLNERPASGAVSDAEEDDDASNPADDPSPSHR